MTASILAGVEMAPRDPILGVTEAFNADPNPNSDSNGNSHGNTWTDSAQSQEEKGTGNKFGATHLGGGDIGQHRHLPQ